MNQTFKGNGVCRSCSHKTSMLLESALDYIQNKQYISCIEEYCFTCKILLKKKRLLKTTYIWPQS